MRFTRLGLPLSNSSMPSSRVRRPRSLMRRRHAIYDYQPTNPPPDNSQAASTNPTVRELNQIRIRLLRFILENQRQREASEQRGFSSRLRDAFDHRLDE